MGSLKQRAEKLKADIPAIFLVLKDRETPAAAKLLAGVTVVYALSPIDLIPDVIPVLGYLDDLILLPVLIALTVRLIPREVWEKNRRSAEKLLENGIPQKWYYAVPVVLVWLVILWLVLKAVG